MDNVLNYSFITLKNHLCEDHNSKKWNNVGIMFYICKFIITKKLCKFMVFQESFCMFKTLKIRMWTCHFTQIKSIFSLSNICQMFSNFLWPLIYFTRRCHMCWTISIFFLCTLLDPNFQKSLMIKVIYNLWWSWFLTKLCIW